MYQYLDLMEKVLRYGHDKKDRTGTGTRSLFAPQMRFDLNIGFPLVTTKKVHLRSIIHELLWFLKGETNIQYLKENGVSIWDGWRRPYVGFTPKIIKIDRLKKGYVPYHGNFDSFLSDFDSAEDKRLATAWVKMMRRCYDATAHNYKMYGGKGVSVAEAWHDVHNYVRDVKLLQNWFYKKNNWKKFELDKDYYGSNQYGPDGCVWLHKTENVHHAWVRIQKGDGTDIICRSYKHAAAMTGLSKSSIHRFVEKGITPHLKGNNRISGVKNWLLQKANTENYLYRNVIHSDLDCGPIYGKQWRDWVGADGRHHDQISKVIDQLRNDPDNRRIIVSAWNVGELDEMALAPCHSFFQFYTRELTLIERFHWRGRGGSEEYYHNLNAKHQEQEHDEFDDLGVPRRILSCQLYQRSADLFLGAPFNIASYALLIHMIAQQVGMAVGEFVWTGGDTHLYSNHLEQARLQLTREPRVLPKLVIKRKPDSIFDYKFEDFELTGYDPHPAIKAPVAI